uniref:Uncharacterized protein n=1 Tax=Anopheles atroparvus TaxID=41427 RepID=A0AAG5DEA2_ANOAO
MFKQQTHVLAPHSHSFLIRQTDRPTPSLLYTVQFGILSLSFCIAFSLVSFSNSKMSPTESSLSSSSSSQLESDPLRSAMSRWKSETAPSCSSTLFRLSELVTCIFGMSRVTDFIFIFEIKSFNVAASIFDCASTTSFLVEFSGMRMYIVAFCLYGTPSTRRFSFSQK